MFAGMNMTLHKAIPITVLPPEPHLMPFPTTGPVRCVVWTKPIFQKRKMRKGLLILLSFIFSVSLFAQESRFEPTRYEGLKEGKSNFHAGIRVGFTGSQITKDGFAFAGYRKFGAFVGPFVNVPVTKDGRWLIQPELNFIMKGCKHVPKTDENGMVYGNLYKLQLMYGEIPVLVKWRIIKGFELEAGPAFGILFKNTDVEQVNGYPNVGAPPFFRFEFAGIIGLNYLFYNHFGVSIRYENSLLPVRKPRQADWIYLLGGQHNQTFCFSAYYQF
jgi:hypothetical protein